MMTMMKLETKFAALDLKASAESGVIEGYASKFGIEDRGGDVMMPGAFKGSLNGRASAGVKMLWQHDPAQPIGVWEEVREDATGLWVKGRILADVARGREAVALLGAGAIDGLSIGYRTIKSEDGEGSQRKLIEVELWEVSLVTFPMLPEATAVLKSDDFEEIKQIMAAGGRLTERQFEKVAKGLGLSNAQAERAARIHLKGQGDPAAAATDGETDALAFLTAALQG
jgi:uncharacterized protein